MRPVSTSAPRTLGRYALHDAIASGGMATVHLARQLGHAGFERTVAIKRLHPQFAQDPEFVSMFLDEARVVARIRHPNVVPTLDVVAAEGELFIVMEYVPGESLARLIRAVGAQGARVPPPIAATLLAGVLHGLHAAHEARSERGEPLGVVHRDISPQNVLVGTDGVGRVLDFGVAKAAGRIQSTREGQLKGKLAYMAPEQISGEVARTTDVYAASVVLWETLAGRRLFAGENDAHLMKLVLEARITPPSEHAADVPAALDALTMRGLSRDPADRFPTAREMALALEEALAPVAASRIGAWVEATAARTLHDRSTCVAFIESNGSLQAPAQPVAVPVGEDLHTQLSSGSVSGAGRLEPRRPGKRALLAAVGVTATAVVVGLSVRASGTRAVAAPRSAETAPAVPPAPPAASGAAAPGASYVAAPPASSSVPTPQASSPSTATAAPRPWRAPLQKPPARRAGVDDGTSDRK